MAYITDKNIIFETMRRDNLPYYKVMDDQKRMLAINDESSDIDMAIKNLDFILGGVTGNVNVIINKRNTKDKGTGGDARNISFMIQLGNPSAKGTAATPNIGSIGGSDLLSLLITQMNQAHQAQMTFMNQMFEQKQENEKLKRQIENPDETEKFAFLNKGLKQVDRLITHIIDHKKPNTVPINGVGAIEKKPVELKKIEMTQEENDKMNLSIHVLLTHDPNFVENLELLAKLVKEDPDMYKTAIKKLKAFS